MPNKAHLDPGLIARAPIEPSPEDSLSAEKDRIISDLGYELDKARAELVRMKGKKSVEDVIVDMLQGYSENVFIFVVCYCVVVGAILVMAGFKKHTGFELSDTILGIIAGSTAVSVIGLIGMVVTGMFGVSKPSARRVAAKPVTVEG